MSRVPAKRCYMCGLDLRQHLLKYRQHEHTHGGLITMWYDVCKHCINSYPIILDTFQRIGGFKDNVAVGTHQQMLLLIQKVKADRMAEIEEEERLKEQEQPKSGS